MTTFRIIRRAFSQYTLAEEFTGTFCEASERADALQRQNRDGEYFPRFPGTGDRENGAPCPAQAQMAYL